MVSTHRRFGFTPAQGEKCSLSCFDFLMLQRYKLWVSLNSLVSTTLELPDTLFKRAKALAAQRGQTMTSFVRSALESKISSDELSAEEKPWMQFAGVHSVPEESKKIMDKIDASCGQVDEGEWQ
ncbi:MAG: putative transcriptional regulator [Lentimonas sp.]